MDNKDKPKKKRGRKPKKDIKKQEKVENVITKNAILSVYLKIYQKFQILIMKLVV